MLPDWLICRPDTLPDSALMSVGCGTCVSCSPETACCDVPIVAFSRCWLSAVTTTPVSCGGALAPERKSCVIEPPDRVRRDRLGLESDTTRCQLSGLSR